MSAPGTTVASTAAPGAEGRRGQRKKGALSSPYTWLIVLGLGLAGGAYLLYRRGKSSAAGTSTGTTATPAGTVAPDWSGEIATLQTEIMDLQSTITQEAASDKDTDTGNDNDDKKTGVPGHVHVTKVTQSSVSLAWDKAVNATAYDVRIAGRGSSAGASKKVIATHRVTGLTTTFTGLRADTPYAVDVQALPGGGTGTVEVTTKAVPRKKRTSAAPTPTAPSAASPAPGTSSPARKTAAHHVTRVKAVA